MYDLTSVCNHSGSLSGGHFTATCRVHGCAGDDVWLDFNDMQVGCVCHTLLEPAKNACSCPRARPTPQCQHWLQ